MSINSAISAAMSGLTAQSRAIHVISANVANSMTEGYATRRLNVASSVVGGGVRVVDVERQTDPILDGLLRQSGGATAGSDTQLDFWNRIEQAIGLPGDPHGLTGKVATLENALVSAAARPDLDHRLSAVADAGNDLAGHLNALEKQVQSQRQGADAAIGADVDALNLGLERIAVLNRNIVRLQAQGHQALGLADERQKLIASLSEIVPIREFQHPDGRIALYSEGGHLLLDTRPAELSFATSPAMDASMALEDGTLSGLRVNGQALSTAQTGPLAGGRLAANFAIRDVDAPSAQTALDRIARSLVERFQDPATDPTTAPGQPGLFTDFGLALDPAQIDGLAGRLALSDTVLPEAGGDLWKLRTGLGAAVPGAVGDDRQLQRWVEALQRPLPGETGSATRSFADNVGQTISGISQARHATEERATHAQAYHAELQHQALSMGVDVDSEMQRLLQVEKAHAANARLLQVADDLMRQILEI
ncbi:MAG: flagellar hook-associated protein 1 FlgK [Rhodobacteraceae bacterium HLUCCA12]|nr:MAG: flagellar hook-associated protein 1 FlgK [Rhodobacteraceae bacterium HLUCCA12]